MPSLKSQIDCAITRTISLQMWISVFALCMIASSCSNNPNSKESGITSAIKQAIAGGDYFEGVLTTKIAINMKGLTADELAKMGNGAEMKIYLKGEHSREESPLGTTTIFNAATQTICLLNTTEKTFYCLGPDKDSSKASEKKQKEEPEPTITATGQTEVIAGYKCEHWVSESKGVKVDICIAKELKQKYWGQELKDYASSIKKTLGEGYPMKMTMEIKSDIITSKSSSEVVKVEPMKLDDSLFAAPAGYKEVPSPFDKLSDEKHK